MVNEDTVAVAQHTGGQRMEILYVALAIAFFGLSWLLVALCERL
jgi:hypothetical protein